MNRRRALALGWSALLLAGCAHPGGFTERSTRARRLAAELRQLGPAVNPAEADDLASAAVHHAALLASGFRPAQPAWFNNLLVNSGLRDRGLCYHWTNELFAHLQPLGLRSFQLHLAVARRATPDEHNAIVVTAAGQPFADGLVLDAWRQAGRLWWGRLADDPRHPWQPLPPEFTPAELRPLLSR